MAGVIVPISATTDMGSTLSNLNNTINGNGLNAFPSLTATHGLNLGNSWSSAVGTTSGKIDFNLGGAFVVDGLSFWNASSFTGVIGINGVAIQSSMDGLNFLTIAGAATSFSRVSLTVPQAFFGQRRGPQLVSFAPVTANFIRFAVNSNHGSPLTTGFAEVAFSGAPVPEPTSLAIGLVMVGVAWRTRRKSNANLI